MIHVKTNYIGLHVVAYAFMASLVATTWIGLAWWLDDSPVLEYISAAVVSGQPSKPGESVIVELQFIKARDCRGEWQPWLLGPVNQPLSDPQLSYMQPLSPHDVMLRYYLPKWLPAGQYDIAFVAWYTCNPLRTIRSDSPMIPIEITSRIE